MFLFRLNGAFSEEQTMSRPKYTSFKGSDANKPAVELCRVSHPTIMLESASAMFSVVIPVHLLKALFAIESIPAVRLVHPRKASEPITLRLRSKAIPLSDWQFLNAHGFMISNSCGILNSAILLHSSNDAVPICFTECGNSIVVRDVQL